jgi:hypothetical protein
MMGFRTLPQELVDHVSVTVLHFLSDDTKTLLSCSQLFFELELKPEIVVSFINFASAVIPFARELRLVGAKPWDSMGHRTFPIL